MNITTIGIDLAKNVFQIHATDDYGKPLLKKTVRRQKLIPFMANLPKSKVFLEACGASNYWAREFNKLGHNVKLISPQFVKPFVKTNKNDANDAEAIVEAGSRPTMHFVNIKSEHQQDIQSIHRIRERLVHNRTALVNEMRGFLTEYGVFVQQGIHNLRKEFVKLLDESSKLTPIIKEELQHLYEEMIFIDEKIKRLDKKNKQIKKTIDVCLKFEKIPGVGDLTATMLYVTLGNGQTFKNGRHFGAFCGLVPRQHSSGGQNRLQGISKRGDVYLRKLLIHGGRAVLRCVEGKTDKNSLWLKNLAKKKGANIAIVAWANKVARMAWAIAYFGEEYNVRHKHIFKKAR